MDGILRPVISPFDDGDLLSVDVEKRGNVEPLHCAMEMEVMKTLAFGRWELKCDRPDDDSATLQYTYAKLLTSSFVF